MRLVMFDIDDTLVQSTDVDSACFASAVKEVVGVDINTNWGAYRHVTDSGILDEVIESSGIANQQTVRDDVKRVFIEKIQRHIAANPVKEVPGAANFLKCLMSVDGIAVSLATGGWLESALIKLKSAGLYLSKIPIASANDHFDRTEIMLMAATRAVNTGKYSCIYFGDGYWDKQACEQLGFDFVLVGNKLEHRPSIIDFVAANRVMDCIAI